MTAFKLTNYKGDKFNVNPQPVRHMTGGWAIQCHSADRSLYSGNYVMNVGFADGANYTFKRKRDAVAAIKEALESGIL